MTNKLMRIGLDARFYGTLGRGLGRYASELIAALERVDDRNDYIVFLRKENFDKYVPRNTRFTKALADIPWYTFREQLAYPAIIRRHRPDLMHFLHFNVPFAYRRPYVVTVHDLILLKHPTSRATTLGPLLYRLKYAAYRRVIARALRDAKGVITVSHCVEKNIRENFPFMKNREITVTYEACPRSSGRVIKGSRGQEKDPSVTSLDHSTLGPLEHSPYALYVGSAYPHKNLERLLKAFAEFRSRGFEKYQLALVLGDDHFSKRLRAEAKIDGLDDSVVFLKSVSDDELATLYSAASFFVFPSLSEGFGLPPLEAMCAGVPVASSNAGCMPEIIGDSARYFDPEDTADMARAMADLASSTELRAELIKKGSDRADRYDWDECARQTLASYQLATEEPENQRT